MSNKQIFRFCIIICVIFITLIGTATFAQDNRFDDLRTIASRDGQVRVIVKLTSDNTADAIRSVQNTVSNSLRNSNASINRVYHYIPYMAMTLDANAIDILARSSAVSGMSQEIPMPPVLDTSATQVGAAGVGGAWDIGFTGRGQTVAILDTGVDYTHSALADSIVAEACFGTNSVTSDYIASPWCANDSPTVIGAGAGRECDLSYYACDHGTHVAGIVTSDDATYTGIALDASIIAIQVFSRFDGSYCGSSGKCTLSYPSDQIAALEYVYELRNTLDIAAVNMSLGGGHYTSACDDADWSNRATAEIINLLYNVDIPVVISSGNSGSSQMGISAPACINKALSIGAVDSVNDRAYFSQNASILDLYAPGVSIASTLPGESYGSFSGTSMSAPHVAGAIALMREANPALRVSDILSILSSTGIDVFDSQFGYTAPMIQVNDAILETFDPAQLIVNGNFELESGKSSDTWTINNATKDKLKCDKPADGKYFAHLDSCAFMFKGSVDEKSKVKQKAHLPSRDFAVGDTLTFSSWIDARSDASRLKIVIKVVYEDGTMSKGVDAFNGFSNGYQLFTGDPITIEQANISKIVTIVKHRSATGKILVDDVQLTHISAMPPLADSATRSNTLPLPEAPDSFRN